MIIDLIDKLIDRAIQLVTYRNNVKAGLLENYVTPVFSEFEQVHAAYLDSFVCYRNFICETEDRTWNKSLQATLERDNLFSANSRSKLVRLAETQGDDAFARFVKEVCDYLMGARLVDPLGKTVQPHRVQRWRQSLKQTLGKVAEKNWQMVIDPDAARPPLKHDDIADELEQRRTKYAGDVTGTSQSDTLERACAIWALDSIVSEMQDQYDRVCEEYESLRADLSK